jgi:hypothetical protein
MSAVSLPSVPRIWGTKPTLLTLWIQEFSINILGNSLVTIRENFAPLSAVTKLRREEWQIVVIRKQKEKREGENELPGIVSSY